MSNPNQDPVMGMQIWTVPQLKDEEDLEEEEPRDIDDDYMDFINQETEELLKRK